MKFISALTEFAAAAANLHPDHRPHYDGLVRPEDRCEPPAKSPAGHLDTPETGVSWWRVE